MKPFILYETMKIDTGFNNCKKYHEKINFCIKNNIKSKQCSTLIRQYKYCLVKQEIHIKDIRKPMTAFYNLVIEHFCIYY